MTSATFEEKRTHVGEKHIPLWHTILQLLYRPLFRHWLSLFILCEMTTKFWSWLVTTKLHNYTEIQLGHAPTSCEVSLLCFHQQLAGVAHLSCNFLNRTLCLVSVTSFVIKTTYIQKVILKNILKLDIAAYKCSMTLLFNYVAYVSLPWELTLKPMYNK